MCQLQCSSETKCKNVSLNMSLILSSICDTEAKIFPSIIIPRDVKNMSVELCGWFMYGSLLTLAFCVPTLPFTPEIDEAGKRLLTPVLLLLDLQG